MLVQEGQTILLIAPAFTLEINLEKRIQFIVKMN